MLVFTLVWYNVNYIIGIDVDIQDKDLNTALHLAAETNQLDIADILL